MMFRIVLVLVCLSALLTTNAWLSARDTEMKAEIQRFCGRDENGTVISEPSYDYCEHPFYTSYPGGSYGIGTVFRGSGTSYGPVYGHFSYFQVAPVQIGFSCDGVLLFDSMYKIMRPRDGDVYATLTATKAEQLGSYGFGKYQNGPISVGMRCLVDPLADLENSNSTYAVRHGGISGCTICSEMVPFDCPTEFERWYLDSELMYRDGNICDEMFQRRNDTVWFPYIEYYYNPSISIYVAYHGEVSELGRNHPFMPGHYCLEGDCPCSLPNESPVYPDSIYGGKNPTWSLPVTLSGYPYHSRTLGHSIAGNCDAAIVQAVFKLSADGSWDTNATVEYGRLNQTEIVDLNELRKDVFTPGIYIHMNSTKSDWPLTPKMSGLMNARLLNYRDDNVTLIRCLIEPNDEFQTEEERYANGRPFDCVSCVHGSPCAAPTVQNGQTEWILDTVIGFLPIGFVPGITVPPGYELTLVAYNATSDTPEMRSNLLADVLKTTDILSDNPMWKNFTYCTNILCTPK